MFQKTALLIILSLPIAALAQSGNSVISGAAKDGSGAAIPGARLKISNDATGVAGESGSNEEAIYRFGSLVPGTYRIEVESQGFDRLVRGPLTLQVGQTLGLDLTLAVGTQSETVTVTEAVPLTDSQTSKIAQVVTKEMLGGLPLP